MMVLRDTPSCCDNLLSPDESNISCLILLRLWITERWVFVPGSPFLRLVLLFIYLSTVWMGPQEVMVGAPTVDYGGTKVHWCGQHDIT